MLINNGAQLEFIDGPSFASNENDASLLEVIDLFVSENTNDNSKNEQRTGALQIPTETTNSNETPNKFPTEISNSTSLLFLCILIFISFHFIFNSYRKYGKVSETEFLTKIDYKRINLMEKYVDQNSQDVDLGFEFVFVKRIFRLFILDWQ